MEVFLDRHDAGSRLALSLQGYAERPDVIVLALPHGGVPVGYEIAKQLLVPLDVLVVRRLRVPGHAELVMGAIASEGVQVIDRAMVAKMNVDRETLEAVIASERAELERSEQALRGRLAPMDVRDKTVIVVDDGLANGSAIRAAIEVLRTRGSAGVVVAVPAPPSEPYTELLDRIDEMICLVAAPHVGAALYRDVAETTDTDVHRLLVHAARELRAAPMASRA